MHNEIWYKIEYSQIQRAILNVSDKLGRSQALSDYKNELVHEFKKLGIPFSEQKNIKSEEKIPNNEDCHCPHFICHGVIAVNIKVLPHTHFELTNQASHYLRISKNKIGILANFGCNPRVTIEKIVP